MELRILHFYPDLMSLYGSYANVFVVKRQLERLGNTVTVESVSPGAAVDLAGADFIFMGAGTEHSQKAALADFSQYAQAVRFAAAQGTTMLFAGTAMELLGRTVTARDGSVYNGIALADFTSVQGEKRIVGDVYGKTELCREAVVGFMNKCSLLSGVETPLLTSLDLGFGNETEGGAEGFHRDSVFASALTGPLLVKNPRLLDAVIAAIYRHREAPLPGEQPRSAFAENGYAITAEQLRLRCQRP